MAATLSPFAPPDSVAQGGRYRLVHGWKVSDAAAIGPVRRQVTHLLASGTQERTDRCPARHQGPARHDDAVTDSSSAARPVGLADLRNRVALICSELVTNAIRYGDQPVSVELFSDGDAWLLDVTDAATDRLPDPDVVRPMGQGGYGLMLVSRLCSNLGWYVRDDRKHVWARIDVTDGNAMLEEIAGNVSSLTEGRDEVTVP